MRQLFADLCIVAKFTSELLSFVQQTQFKSVTLIIPPHPRAVAPAPCLRPSPWRRPSASLLFGESLALTTPGRPRRHHLGAGGADGRVSCYLAARRAPPSLTPLSPQCAAIDRRLARLVSEEGSCKGKPRRALCLCLRLLARPRLDPHPRRAGRWRRNALRATKASAPMRVVVRRPETS